MLISSTIYSIADCEISGFRNLGCDKF